MIIHSPDSGKTMEKNKKSRNKVYDVDHINSENKYLVIGIWTTCLITWKKLHDPNIHYIII